MVIRMFAVMCANCPDLAVCLLRQDVSNTLVYLLCGEQGASAHIEVRLHASNSPSFLLSAYV